MKTNYFLFTLVALTLATSPVYGQQSPQTVFRDSSGRTTGTATIDSQGTTTFRDAGGRTTGTASPSNQGSGGVTTFRDSGGRTTGTAQSPLPPFTSLPFDRR